MKSKVYIVFNMTYGGMEIIFSTLAAAEKYTKENMGSVDFEIRVWEVNEI